MTNEEIELLTLDQVRDLTTEEIENFSLEQLDCLNQLQFKAMDAEQKEAMRKHRIKLTIQEDLEQDGEELSLKEQEEDEPLDRQHSDHQDQIHG